MGYLVLMCDELSRTEWLQTNEISKCDA